MPHLLWTQHNQRRSYGSGAHHLEQSETGTSEVPQTMGRLPQRRSPGPGREEAKRRSEEELGTPQLRARKRSIRTGSTGWEYLEDQGPEGRDGLAETLEQTQQSRY